MMKDVGKNKKLYTYAYICITLVAFAFLPFIFACILDLIVGYRNDLLTVIEDGLLIVFSIVLNVIVCVYEFRDDDANKKGTCIFGLFLADVVIVIAYCILFDDYTMSKARAIVMGRKLIPHFTAAALAGVVIICWMISSRVRLVADSQESRRRQLEKENDALIRDYEKRLGMIAVIIEKKNRLQKSDIEKIQAIVEGSGHAKG